MKDNTILIVFIEDGLSLDLAVSLALLAFFFVDFQQLIKRKASSAVELEILFDFIAHENSFLFELVHFAG